MLLEFLQNPIVIGVIASILTYLYLRYDNEKKYKDDPKNIKNKVSLLTPGIVGAVTWYIVANYCDHKVEQIMIPQTNIQHLPSVNVIDTRNQLLPPVTGPTNVFNSRPVTNNDSLSLESKSYHLVGKGKITVPESGNINNALPDMFIELDNFS